MSRSALFLVIVVAGCGGAQTPQVVERERAIDAIRGRAAAHPDDADAARALAEWELLGDDGDIGRVAEALDHAASLAPDDIAIDYLRGVDAEQHGHAEAATAAFVDVLRGARTSDDALAPFYVESALAYLHELRIDTPRFDETVPPALEALFRDPSRLGFPARRQAFFWLRDLAAEHGDMAEVTRLESLLGCPTEMRAAGPFGPTVLAAFDQTLAAEGRGPLADRYDLGPGRGVVATRALEVEHCSATLGLADGHDDGRSTGPGTRIVESTIHVAEAGPYVIALSTGGSVQATIDGELAFRTDRRERTHGIVTFHALTLSAGDHELELKIASRAATPAIAWTLDRATDGYAPATGIELPDDPEGPLARFVTLDVRSIRGETIAARELLRAEISARSSAALLALAARIAASDPFVPDAQRGDDERRLVSQARERDPEAYWPQLRAAALETGDVEALAALRGVADHFPQLASLQLGLAAALSGAGYQADADAAIERARVARPDACAVTNARFSALAQRGRVEAASELADALLACDQRSEVRFRLAVGRRDWTAARAEMTRLAPFGDADHDRSLALAIAVGSGDTAEERRLVQEIESEAAPSDTVVHEADRRYAAGARAEALALLTAETERAPHRAVDLRSLVFALSGDDVMESYRADGLDVVRRFEASGRTYEGHAAVLVFDYMVTRIFEDGSAIDLVHQIYRVQTAEGVERFGDLAVPGRALTVRVIGADGTTREPDTISGNVSMPPLSVGDYVEYEIVREHAPRWGDGYASEGWVFQNFTEPFDHSEMVFVAPPSLDVQFDVRGPVPPVVTSDQHGLRAYRFVVEQSARLTQEPNWVAEPPVLPSLRAATRVTWDRMYDAVLDGLLGLDLVDPAAVRLLDEEILANGASLSPHERVQRIHRWVMENVEPVADTFYGLSPLMVSARRGNRLRVLRYLLELAHVPAQIAFARTITSGTPNDSVPHAEVYGTELVIATLDDGPLYLLTAGRGYAHDYFPSALAGQEAIVVAPGLPRVQLGAAQGVRPSQRFEGEIAIAPSGVARVTLTITFGGGAAAELRNAIREVAPAERATLLAERFVPSIIPGGASEASSVVVRGLDAWEEPLSIAFVAESAGMIQPARDGYHIVPLFGSGVEQAFARLPSRTTTELVGEVDTTVSLRFVGPGILHVPQAVEASGPRGAHASVIASAQPDGSVQLERHVVVPLSVVTVAEYPALAQFCRLTTQIDQRTVVITPQ
jgi:tetratricopeptide (TPR) repeat protein